MWINGKLIDTLNKKRILNDLIQGGKNHGRWRSGEEELRFTQKSIYRVGAFPSFIYGPDNKALTAAHIAGSENLGDICLIGFICCFYISSFIKFGSEFIQHTLMLRMYKAHS